MKNRRLSARAVVSLMLSAMLFCMPMGAFFANRTNTIEVHAEYSEISDVEEAIDILTDSYHDKFPVEYSNAEKTVCYMIVIHKYVEGGYDNEINI